MRTQRPFSASVYILSQIGNSRELCLRLLPTHYGSSYKTTSQRLPPHAGLEASYQRRAQNSPLQQHNHSAAKVETHHLLETHEQNLVMLEAEMAHRDREKESREQETS